MVLSCFLKILPQLLYYLKLEKRNERDSIDWGTLVVYSCSASCGEYSRDNVNQVKEEFLWRQPAEKLV